MTTGFIKTQNYVLTIEVLDNYTPFYKVIGGTPPGEKLWVDPNIFTIVNPETALYDTKHFKVVAIENIFDNTTIDTLNKYTVGEIICGNTSVPYFKQKQLAMFQNFIALKQYEMFDGGFTGVCLEHYCCGMLMRECHFENGKLTKTLFYHKQL